MTTTGHKTPYCNRSFEPPGIARRVMITHDSDTLVVSVDLTGMLPLGLRIHKGARDSALRIAMARSGGAVTTSGRLCRFPSEEGNEAKQLALELQRSLDELARRPIGQRHVERLLGISSSERIRWSKDGRLATSGTSKIRKGTRLITLLTYPPAAIDALLQAPETIARWREADATQ